MSSPRPPFPLDAAAALERLRGLLAQWPARAPEPPAWLIEAVQARLLLLLNHLLSQEPEAMQRLKRQQGKAIALHGGRWQWVLQPSAAGLLESAAGRTPQLRIALADASPRALASAVFSGQRPAVEVEGDVQLAAEVAWLVDHVRWDIEEDLSRWLGDAAAHALVSQCRDAASALRTFLARGLAAAEGLRRGGPLATQKPAA